MRSQSRESAEANDGVGLLRQMATRLEQPEAEADATQARLLYLLQAVAQMRPERSEEEILQAILDLACVVTSARYGRLLVEWGFRHTYAVESGNPPPQDGPLLDVPLVISEEHAGHLTLGRKSGVSSAFSTTDRQLAVALATIAAMSVHSWELVDRIRRRQAWLEAALDVDARLLGGLPREDSLQLITQRAREVCGATVGIALPVPGEKALRVEAVSGPGAERMLGMRLSENSLARHVLDSGRPEIVDARRDPRWEMPEGGEAGPAIVLPLGADEHLSGTIGLFYPPGGPEFRSDDVQVATAFAHQAGFALQLAQAQTDRSRLAVLEERDRIAQDLHDVVIQRLFATGLSLQRFASGAGSPPVVAASVDEIDRTIRELRQVIFPLRRTHVGGVRVGISEIVRSTCASLGFSPRVELEGTLDALPSELAEAVLAVVQEALSNVARHAAPSAVTLRLSVSDEVSVFVRDDGVGIPGPPPEEGGLANIARRAERLGGSCEVDSSPGGGTTVHWRVPLSHDNAEPDEE